MVARPCAPACQRVCPQCGSTECLCCCTRDCPEIPYALSSDPVDHPLEPGITALVFELKRLNVYYPCWSCEGHESPDRGLWRIPRVWFYCRSVVHVRLLSDGVKELFIRKITGARWQVVVTFSEVDNPDTMFSLEPVVRKGGSPRLSDLQNDAVAIAERLHSLVTGRATVLARTT